ncbi:hypothetical protein SEA_HANNABELLA_49 [Microbacterium phage Hannabella]|uniref:Uncharacterized protein n=1 Tax=Microbacterium phage Arete TaxID=2713257 RepID=A0A6G8R157_9CAUD|nr:hypothetical protein HWD16_gp49 [Microbacterium phage Arete]QIN93932.1 hypothetical protein SEA_ARETE_49 [Microbacterium phage Arete]URM86442.1 hypothetical protein SEA_GSHELBY23_47 [Microbacterium phage Gshelby23]UVG34255.1 hypothetical protein SEA_HANNABELLA_49 [Microbacterium phage Hannabella]
MSSEIVQVKRQHFRQEIPETHRVSLDTRIRWLWNQRFGTVQSVYKNSKDMLDRTAATMFIQAIWARDMNSVQLILNRLEGGPITDEELVQRQALRV